MNPIKKVWSWFTAKDERTWLSHGLIAVGAIAGGHLAGGPGAALAIFAFYLIRELKDSAKTGGWTSDNTGDLGAPTLVVLIYFLVLRPMLG